MIYKVYIVKVNLLVRPFLCVSAYVFFQIAECGEKFCAATGSTIESVPAV